ncbi:MAG: transglycosylase domain-containing protein, partial [bacterium]|nr:transglycosylase domain-containing protein [bacterium]
MRILKSLRTIRWAVALSLFALLFLFLSSLIFVPQIFYLKYFNPGRTAFMREKGGAVIQTWVPLRRISPYLRQAVVLSEDGTFYEHHGIDLFEVQESLKANLHKGRWVRGGSTITMQ